MANYTSNLVTWGDTGSAYPSGYNYLGGEQPVDAYDNFFNYNVIEDIQHLITLTNEWVESSTGTTRPASPEVGEIFINTDTGDMEYYTGSVWLTVTIGGGNLTDHINDTMNPHSVTYTQVGAIQDATGTVTETHLSFDPATQTELNTHTSDTTNPHSVTAAQVAAVALAGDTMTGDLNGSQNQLCDWAFKVTTADPTTPVTGEFWFRSDLSELRFYDGAATQIVTTTTAA